jgi:hypothetical protein
VDSRVAPRPQSLSPEPSEREPARTAEEPVRPRLAPRPWSLWREWFRLPLVVALLVLAAIATWTSWLLQREIELRVADELKLLLAAEIEVAEALLDPRDERAGLPSHPDAQAEKFVEVLGRLPVLSRVGRSGETYAFDRDGVMLTPSRFDDELREQDLLVQRDGRMVVELRDPGGHVAAGHRPTLPRHAQPLTKLAATALGGRDGVDVAGYRDYRGVEVVGAWRWLSRYQLGVAVEIDADEAFALNDGLRAALFAVYLAMALSLLAVGGSSRVYARARSEIAQARQLGQYTLVRELGRGGMGTVYEAKHALLRRPTAVKLISAEASDGPNRRVAAEAILRFEREVQLTSQLTHPNTVIIYDYGRTREGVFYYAMEYIDGVNLDTLVHLDGPLPVGRAIHFALQVCGSLAEAHARSLIHRDIKPANLIVCERGGVVDTLKVLDFGLVKSLHGPQVSAAHVVVGTPHFMAPEVMHTPALADARSDIYALGAVLYWLTTGRTVYDERSSLNTLREMTDVVPPSGWRPEIPADFERVILRCLSREPAARPGSMLELAVELRACRSHGSWSEQDARRYWHERGALLVREWPAPTDVPTLAAS